MGVFHKFVLIGVSKLLVCVQTRLYQGLYNIHVQVLRSYVTVNLYMSYSKRPSHWITTHWSVVQPTLLIVMFLVTSPIDVPTRGLLAVETMYAIVQWPCKFEYQKKHDVNVCKQETLL